MRHASGAGAQLSTTPIRRFSDVEAADIVDFDDEKGAALSMNDSVDNVEMKEIENEVIHWGSHLLEHILNHDGYCGQDDENMGQSGRV